MLRKNKKDSGTDIYNTGNYEDSYCDDYDPYEDLYEDAPRKDLKNESPDDNDGGSRYKDNKEYRDEDYGDESYEDDDFLSDLDDDEIDKLAELDDGDGFDDSDDIDDPDDPDDSDNSDSFNDSDDGLTATKLHRTAKDNKKRNIARIANEATDNTTIDNTRASSPSRSLSSATRQHRKHEMHYSKKKEKQINRLFIAMLSLFMAGIPAMFLYIVTKANSIHSAITFVPSEHVADNAFQYWIGFFGCVAMITSLVAMLTMMLTDNVPKLFRPFLYSSVFRRRSAASSREMEENDGFNPDEEDPSDELSKGNKEAATNNPDKADKPDKPDKPDNPKEADNLDASKAQRPDADAIRLEKPSKPTKSKDVTGNASNAVSTSVNADATETAATSKYKNTGNTKAARATKSPRAETLVPPVPLWVKQTSSGKRPPAWAQPETKNYF